MVYILQPFGKRWSIHEMESQASHKGGKNSIRQRHTIKLATSTTISSSGGEVRNLRLFSPVKKLCHSWDLLTSIKTKYKLIRHFGKPEVMSQSNLDFGNPEFCSKTQPREDSWNNLHTTFRLNHCHRSTSLGHDRHTEALERCFWTKKPHALFRIISSSPAGIEHLFHAKL